MEDTRYDSLNGKSAALMRILLPILLLQSALASPREYLQCSHKERFKDGSSQGAELDMKVEAGSVVQLVVYSTFASGKEGGGYMCSIDTSEKSQAVEWGSVGHKTILHVDQSVVEIESTAKGFRLNLEKASRDACGFGAEWPKEIQVTRGEKACKVVYGD